MTRAREIRASEEMRDRIADMLHRAGIVRRRSPTSVSKAKLLFAMERDARALPGRPAEGGDDGGR